MDIRVMQYVLAVYEEQSFTRAAKRLHVAQPSLSQRIAKLETELGLRLFQRGPGAVTPTPNGLRFVVRAQEMICLHDQFVREMQDLSAGIGTRLVIGTTAITGGRLLPGVLQAFERRYPTVQPRLVEESTETLVDLTARGLIDIAILPLPVDDSRLAVQPLLTEPLLLAVPPRPLPWMPEAVRRLVEAEVEAWPKARVDAAVGRHQAGPRGEVATAGSITTEPADPGSLDLSALADAPFVLLKPGFAFRHNVLQLCAESGFQPSIAYETSSIDTAQALVAHGLGVTVVPRMVVLRQEAPLYVSLAAQPTRTLAVAHQRDGYLTLAVRAFIEVCRDVVR